MQDLTEQIKEERSSLSLCRQEITTKECRVSKVNILVVVLVDFKICVTTKNYFFEGLQN
jgi:hypothetical protein